ncbi:MAG: peptidylprolyl isomerase [Bacteroidota bacterium]
MRKRILNHWAGAATLLLLLLMAACEPVPPTVVEIDPNLKDEQVRQIIALQDKRDAKGLMAYLSAENPNHRYMAAYAAGSIQDSSLIDTLAIRLTKESYEETRVLLAYALGQTKNAAAIPGITGPFKAEPSRAVQGALLEAIGKCGTEKELEFLANSKPYPANETELHQGLLQGIFRFSLREIASTRGTQKVINELLIPGLSADAKRYGAAYLKRARDIDLSPFQNNLLELVKVATDSDVRINLLGATGRLGSPEAFAYLDQQFQSSDDYRERCEIIRALRHFDYTTGRRLAFLGLQDANPHVQICAADHLLANGINKDTRPYFEEAVKKQDDPEIYSTLMAAVLRHTAPQQTQTKDFFTRKLLIRLDSTSNPYEKAAYLTALQEHVFNYQIIARHTFRDDAHPAVRSAGVAALANIRENKNFNRLFGQFRRTARNELDNRLRQAVESGDVAMVGLAAAVFQNPELGYRERFKDISFLEAARDSMALPRDIEGWYAIQQTIDFLKGETAKPADPPKWNHPIDWTVLDNLGDTIPATIQLSSGAVKLELYPAAAPGTVANFIALTKSTYYDNKTIHRVVPNFVIQGGCPRGDGWGSEDYSIRSETGHLYYDGPGYIGIASAGKDTEGVQWFITHSATPLLDGRYTIFGKVTTGMDAVHGTRVGDLIKTVQIQ